MGKVGLSGRAFIPLLSSFACAIPGIMATRTIANWKDRLATIMVAPLMTCSARLPVYALLIGAFVPATSVGPFNLRGLTLFGLYVAGVVSAMAVAWVFKRVWIKRRYQPLMLELPPYRMPSLRNLGLGLWERAAIFMRRVGGIIFTLMVVLWFLSSFPAPPAGATGPAIQYSVAGMIGHALEHVFAPIGFNWQISIALVPGLAAREVAVGALGTVYSMSAAGDSVADALAPIIAKGWSLATAYSLLAWYVFAPQCLSTLAVVTPRDELVALSAHHGGVPVRARLHRLVHHLSRDAGARRLTMVQSLIVAFLVVACALRAAWILAPAAARRSVARALLAWPLPRVLARRCASTPRPRAPAAHATVATARPQRPSRRQRAGSRRSRSIAACRAEAALTHSRRRATRAIR